MVVYDTIDPVPEDGTIETRTRSDGDSPFYSGYGCEDREADGLRSHSSNNRSRCPLCHLGADA